MGGNLEERNLLLGAGGMLTGRITVSFVRNGWKVELTVEIETDDDRLSSVHLCKQPFRFYSDERTQIVATNPVTLFLLGSQ